MTISNEDKITAKKTVISAVVLAIVSGVLSGLGAAWAYIANYAESGEIVEYFGGITAQRAVIAFEYEGNAKAACPKGWSPYEPAMGRLIVGAGSRSGLGIEPSEHAKWKKVSVEADGIVSTDLLDLEIYDAGESGGAETVTLTEAQMPMHSHRAKYTDAYIPQPGQNGFYTYSVQARSTTYPSAQYVEDTVVKSGGNLPHNNMPPYIALYFCKKD